MRILFRLDGNAKVGLGHLHRSIAIANALQKLSATKNPEIYFLSERDVLLEKVCAENNYPVHEKHEDVSEEHFILDAIEKIGGDVIFLDKIYAYTPEFIQSLKQRLKVLMFHNVCEGGFSADTFVLPAAHIESAILEDERWKNSEIHFYQGPEYIVLNEKVKKNSSNTLKIKAWSEKINIVVSTGGSDPEGVLFYLLEWMDGFQRSDVSVTFLIGEAFAHQEKLSKLKLQLPPHLKVVPYDFMQWLEADLAISTFGVTTYELMHLGIPVLCIGHALQNAKRSHILAQRYQATVDLGYFKDVQKEVFLTQLNYYTDNYNQRQLLRQRARGLVDGKGAERVAQLVYELALQKNNRRD